MALLRDPPPSPRLSARQRLASPHSPHSARSLPLAAGSSSHGAAPRRRTLRRRVPAQPPHHSPPPRATSTAISRATLLTRSPRESTGGEAQPCVFLHAVARRSSAAVHASVASPAPPSSLPLFVRTVPASQWRSSVASRSRRSGHHCAGTGPHRHPAAPPRAMTVGHLALGVLWPRK